MIRQGPQQGVRAARSPRFARRIGRFGAVFAASLALSSANAGEEMAQTPSPTGFDVSVLESAALQNGDDSAVLISPLGLAAVATILGEARPDAAKTETAAQNVLPPGMLEAMLAFDATANTEGPARLQFGSAIWIDNDVKPRQAAIDRLGSDLGFEISRLNMASEGQPLINAWARERTDGMIDQLIGAPMRGVDAAATNAIYFSDEWAVPFSKRRTKPRAFTAASGETFEAPFMISDAPAPVWRIGDDIWVALGFSGGATLALRLPGESGTTLPAPALQLDAAELAGVALPKFALSQSDRLNPLLRELGLGELMWAGFRALADQPIRLGPVAQEIRFVIDEVGAEAAVATVALAVRSATPTLKDVIVFNRPFDAYLIHPAFPAAIVAARINDPRKQEAN